MAKDIANWLRMYAQQFEDQHAPQNMTIALREAARELDRLYAGGCARDQSTTQYCAEAARLAAELHIATEWSAQVHAGQQEDADTITALRAEMKRLRAALATVMGTATHGQNMTWEERCRIGRAALEEKTDV